MIFHEPFGINQSYQLHDDMKVMLRDLTTIRNLGIKWLRTTFDWRHIESRRGNFSFQIYDLLVKLSRERKINLLPILGYCPSWAAERWNFPPEDYNDFVRFSKAVVDRYKNDIQYWEIWNEADNYFFWVGNTEEYLRLLRLASKAIKKIDPTSKILNCGLSDPSNPNLDFFSVITDSSNQDYIDILNLHAYPEVWNKRKVEDWTTHLRNLDLTEFLENKSVWITETGYGISSSRLRLSQAFFLLRIMASLFGSGITTRVFWHELRDSSSLRSRFLRRKNNVKSFGIIQSYNLMKRSILRLSYPSYSAYAKFIKALSQVFWNGPKVEANYSSEEISIQSFQNTDSLIMVIWGHKERLPQPLAVNLPVNEVENIKVESILSEFDRSIDFVFDRNDNRLIIDESMLSKDPFLVVVR